LFSKIICDVLTELTEKILSLKKQYMKKKTIITAVLACAILNCEAQPNGGFENWTPEFTYENPDSWQTLNFLSLLSPPNPLSAFKAIGIDKHSGNYALKLTTVFLNNKPQQAALSDSVGGAFTGKINYSPLSQINGFPFTGRPEKLEFWFKYLPVGSDIGKVEVVIQKWNGTGRDTIAIGNADITAAAAYTLFQINLTYFSTAVPDTAGIGFSTSKQTDVARLGSTLFVDDVLFTGSAGIDEQNSYAGKVKVFPNPSKDDVTIHIQIEEAENVRVLDPSGKAAGIFKIQNNKVSINTALIPAGIYFYVILGKKDEPLTEGKFSVIK